MSGPIQSFEDLEAWKLGMRLVVEVYGLTKKFPPDERFGLTQQVQRAAVSVPSNIAEGWGRQVPRDFARFLRMSRGSLYEVQTQLLLARALDYITTDEYAAVLESLDHTGRVLAGLLRSVESRIAD
jgi:four helix bundle protein